MKKTFKYFKTHPIYFLLFLCLLFLPPVIVAQPETQSTLIVRALGIDKTEEGYDISTVVLTPKSDQMFGENYKLIEGKGKSVSDAIAQIGVYSGKNIGLSHTGIVFVNDLACKTGLIEILDFLIREYSLGNNISIMYVQDSTKDVINASLTLAKESEISLDEISVFNENKILFERSTIESVHDSSNAPSRCSLLSVIKLSDENGLETKGSQSNESSGNEDSSGDQTESTQQSQKKNIENSGEALVLKEGKEKLLLTKEEVLKYKWTKNSKGINYADVFILENFSDENLTNANVSVILENNKVEYNIDFNKAGNPIFEYKISPTVRIVEVNQKILDKDIYISPNKLSTNKLENAINSYVENNVREIITKLQFENLDLNKIYEKINAVDNKMFKKYLDQLSDKSKYLENIEFKYECQCEIL